MTDARTGPRSSSNGYPVPDVDAKDAERVAEILQGRLVALSDLHLTLKHVHWNVVGPHFIAVHQMLDPQVDSVRLMADDVAERIATLGSEPLGTPGAIVAQRSWDDYSLNRAGAIAHLGALDLVYAGVISDHRRAIAETAELDPVTQDLLLGQACELEKLQWFGRAQLETAGGHLQTEGAQTETDAAVAASAPGER